MCRDQGSGTETKDKEKRSAEASIEARHADTETREKTTGETDRVEGSAEAPGSGAEAKDMARGVSVKILWSCRFECRGESLSAPMSISRPALQTRLLLGF